MNPGLVVVIYMAMRNGGNIASCLVKHGAKPAPHTADQLSLDPPTYTF